MTNKITVKDLIDNYKKAVLIDMDRKNIFIVKDGAIKVYPKKSYSEILDNLGLENFDALMQE